MEKIAKKKKKLVFVGMSGGVDSSVSAALLQQQGYEVVGVFIKTWHPDFIKCNEEEERRDAMRVCAHLGIPFLTFDLEKEYKQGVADYMIAEYKAGRTPNPDVMCNREVKFGAFMKRALSMGADFVATGHYAQGRQVLKNFAALPSLRGLRHGQNFSTPAGLFKNFFLLKSIDPSKDQSYFLWTLKAEQLSKILFPIGHLKKTQVRALAKKFKLPVAEKKDSQGICFLGDIDLKEFLKHYIKEKKGKVLNAEGEEIGYHMGAVFSTLGERHGFTITKKGTNDARYYVVGKDVKKNILYVAQGENPLLKSTHKILLNFCSARPSRPAQGFVKEDFRLSLATCNWISEIPQKNKEYTAQIRYHGEFLPCQVSIKPKGKAEVISPKPVMVAPGQSVVIYDKDIVLGGGIVA